MNARTHAVTALALALLCVGPVVSVAGEWAPLAGLLAAVLFLLAARFAPPRTGNRWLDALCPMAAAGILAHGLGEYLVPGYPGIAAVLALGLLALAVGLRAGCPNVVLWMGIGLVAITGVLVLGADLGIAPAAHPQSSTNPLWLFPAAVLMFTCAAPEGEVSKNSRVGAGLLACVFGVVCWANERQLGAARLALSPAPLAEGLRAADADSLLPLLAVALALMLAIGVHALLAQSARSVPIALPAVGAAVIAVLLPIGVAVVAAAALVVLRWAIGWLRLARAIR